MSNSLRILPALVAAAVVLAGCGGGKASSSSSTAAPGAAQTTSPMMAASGASSSMAAQAGSMQGSRGSMRGAMVAASMPPSMNCGAVKPVWVNLTSKVYHEPGDPYYGKTRRGEYLCPAQAKAQGYHAAGGGTMMSHRRHGHGPGSY